MLPQDQIRRKKRARQMNLRLIPVSKMSRLLDNLRLMQVPYHTLLLLGTCFLSLWLDCSECSRICRRCFYEAVLDFLGICMIGPARAGRHVAIMISFSDDAVVSLRPLFPRLYMKQTLFPCRYNSLNDSRTVWYMRNHVLKGIAVSW